MHIILTGATGLIGSGTLRQCLSSPNITRVSILSRRQFALPDDLDSSKATIIVHEKYDEYPPSLLDMVKGADGCIWAQGISQSQVSKEEYIRITHDYPVAAAKAFSTLSDKGHFNFVYVSGEGADPTEKTWTLFGKIKGRTELALRTLSSSYSTLSVYNIRPGMVGAPATDSSFKGKVLKAAVPLLTSLTPSSYISPPDVVGKAAVLLVSGDGKPVPPGVGVEDEGRTLRCSGIRRLAGLSAEC
ncbi:hypothetical protein FB45DRAFT_993384 [Roridomyces roridus]|uniref:Nucleoside-diphosphate-sugar epimerase n=1 Tax=Roridomyces roridus TaxID=1738132 RepID=A0AAD7B4V5_9AGAR|nr:hypothetical protein FB45DRAFT_993384 [Roridomyces roridus]